ncbi:MAG: AAA family ATPase [Betaproteobacteria bacterium]|nr:AAA family ATPase [Betaproteobacteria bacterium]
MYLSHYGLNEPPFKITPLTEFFYGGANRKEILDALIYAIAHGEGIVKVTGEVGSGKTMLCRVLMERLPESVEIIYLANPSLSRDEILYAVADDLGLDVAGQRTTMALKALHQALIERYASGKRVVVLVDEAHAMPLETLEEIRLLYNLESGRHKLLQIVLFGQQELDHNLNLPQMRQLKDRITHHFTMQPYTEPVVTEYLMFRMRAAGYKGPDLFSREAVRLITRASQGLTRRVNVLADKSLLAAFVGNTHGVEARHARAAIRDSEYGKRDLAQLARPALIAGGSLAAGLALGLAWHLLADSAGEGTAPKLEARVSPPASASQPRTAETPVAPSPVPAGVAPAPQLSATEIPVAPAPPVAAPHPAAAAAGKSSAHDAASDAPRRVARSVKFPPVNATGYKLLQQRIAAAKALLEGSDAQDLSLQLFITDDVRPERMERFLERAGQQVRLSELYVIPVRDGRKTRLWVLYGAYATQAEAKSALAQMPEKYKASFKLRAVPMSEVLKVA